MDGNGVRDDVQRFIEVKYVARPDLKREAFRYVVNELRLIELGGGTPNKDDVSNLVKKAEIGIECLVQNYPTDYEDLIVSLSAKTMNTKARALAKTKALSVLNGSLIISSNSSIGGVSCQ